MGRASDRLNSVGWYAPDWIVDIHAVRRFSAADGEDLLRTMLSCRAGRGGSDGPGDAIAFAGTLADGTSPRATLRRNPDHRAVGSPDVDARDDDRHVAECRMPVAVSLTTGFGYGHVTPTARPDHASAAQDQAMSRMQF